MSTITEFLLARISEDEEDWRVLAEREVHLWLRGKPLALRLLAECEVKRRVVENCTAIERGLLDCPHDLDADEMLRYLASVYADHPDFRDEWRVA